MKKEICEICGEVAVLIVEEKQTVLLCATCALKLKEIKSDRLELSIALDLIKRMKEGQ